MNQEQHAASLQALIKRRALLALIVVTLACLIIWIGVSMYFSLRKTSLPINVQKQLTPLTPVIDNKTLKELEVRKQYTPEELANFPVVKEITIDEGGVGSQKKSAPSPTPSSQKSSTSSAQQKTATDSAGTP